MPCCWPATLSAATSSSPSAAVMACCRASHQRSGCTSVPLTTSRSGAAVAAAGTNYELDAIAACFIGGAAVSGGIGRVSGTIIGAFIMGVLNMGLSILAVDAAWQQAIKGLVLLLAVAFDQMNKRRGARR